MAAIDFGALLDVIWVSLLAGVGVTVLYSLVILGAARARDSTAYGALMLGSLVAFAGAVAFGVSVMLEK